MPQVQALPHVGGIGATCDPGERVPARHSPLMFLDGGQALLQLGAGRAVLGSGSTSSRDSCRASPSLARTAPGLARQGGRVVATWAP